MSRTMDKETTGLIPYAQRPTSRYHVCAVFRYKTNKYTQFEDEDTAVNRSLQPPGTKEKKTMQGWKLRRESLVKQLRNCGVNVFCYKSRDADEIFCKIGGDPMKLQLTAHRMKYALKLKEEYFGAYAEYRMDPVGRAPGKKAPKSLSDVYERYYESGEQDFDEGSFFTTRDKIFLVNHAITAKDKDCAGINIAQLLHDKALGKSEALLTNYFPLHEEHKLDKDFRGRKHWQNWILMPAEFAHKVRDYFGDEVAYYYLFMSYYWQWMFIPGFLGAALQIIDVVWRTPDNITAVPFCIFLSIWSILMPHFWRRQEAKYSIAWGTFDMVPELEPVRPEHYGEARMNPVTAQVENYYPWEKRMQKYFLSAFVILISGVLVVVSLLGMLWFRHKYQTQVLAGRAGIMFLTAVLVEVVNAGLTKVARWLTTQENHRTQSEHETRLLIKVFLFKFVNAYFVLYYVAFFKKHSMLFGSKMECIRDDCFLDLQLALAIFMLVRLTVMNIVSFLKPYVKVWWRGVRDKGRSFMHNVLHQNNRLELAEMSAAEVQSRRDPYRAFDEFDETLITHGYATLFSVTSPWVTTATLLWILVATLVDVKSLTELTRRPFPLAKRNNEPWDTAFDIYGVLATITNVVSLIFASDLYDGWTFTEKLVLFIVLIHAIMFVKLIIKAIFPEVPASVLKLQEKQYMAVRRCMTDTKVEPQQDFSMFRDQDHHGFEGAIAEQDYLDDHDDVEPELSLKNSARVMGKSIAEMERGPACILLVMVILTCIVGGGLFIYNKSVSSGATA